MSSGDGLVGVDKRLSQLTNPDQVLLGYARASETEEGVYYIVLRTWPHPDVEDAWTVAVRYAYLTKGNGSDGWTQSGVNLRCEGDPETFLRTLAKLFLGGSQRVPPETSGDTSETGGDPWTGDVATNEDR